MSAQASPSKHFCFTYNGPARTGAFPMPPEELYGLALEWPCTYVCFQQEIGEQGTAHYQGIYF